MKKVVSKSLLLMGLLGMSGLAFATQDAGGPGSADVWRVYAFSNAKAVSETFRAINNFVASGMFLSLFSFVAMLGLFGVLFTGGFGPGGAKKFINYIVATLFISYLFTGFGAGRLVVQVEVVDTVTDAWVAPVEVPFIVGVPAAVISTAGHSITQQIEASFILPEEFKLANGAPFNLVASLLNDASKAKISDAQLSRSMAYYVQDCFTSGVAAGALEATVLLNSTDFLKDIKYHNEAMMVNTELPASGGPTGGAAPVGPGASMELVNCVDAYNRIMARVPTGDAADYFTEASAWHGTAALDVLNTAADAVGSAVSGGTLSGASMVKQAAVLSTFTGSYSKIAAATGNSDFLSAIAIEQAKSSQFNSWVVGAEMFNRTMGYIYAILQVFVYATAPLVFMAILIPGVGGSLAKSFAQILVWLALWQPLLSIVNFVVLSLQLPDLQGLMAAGGEGFGMTMSTIGLVSEKTANMRAAAAVVGMMVPILAWGMVKGAIDMTKFVTTAAGEQFSSSAANTMATGNYSLNQASMDSFTANKSSISQTSSPGGAQTVTDGIISQKTDYGGSTTQIMGQGASLTGSSGGDVGKSTTLQDATANTQAVQQQASGGMQYSGGRATAAGTSGGNTRSAVDASGVNAQVGADAHVAAKGGGGGSNSSLGATGAPALPGSVLGQAPGQTTGAQGYNQAKPPGAIGKVAGAIGNAAGARASMGAGGTRNFTNARQNSYGNQASDNRVGSVTAVGSSATSTSEGANRTSSAAEAETASTRTGLQATAVSGAAASVMAERQVREAAREGDPFTGSTYRAAKGTALYEQIHGTGSPELDKASAAVNGNQVAAAQATIQAEFLKRQEGDDQTIKNLDKEAEGKKAAAAAAAASAASQAGSALGAAQTASQVTAGAMAVKAGVEFKDDAVEYVADKAGNVADAAKSAAQNGVEYFNDAARRGREGFIGK